MKHKHAEFFTAIANGESLDDWECSLYPEEPFCKVDNSVSAFAKEPATWLVRRKQVTHEVNGFTVPAPLRFAPAKGAVCFAACTLAMEFAYKMYWAGDAIDETRLKRGLIHLTKEAAVANAKAMCGIDPESDDE